MSAAKVNRDRTTAWGPVAEREDERRRLARELHDGPAQALAAALFGVDLAAAALERRPETARDELLRAREQVREALDDLRDLMTGLRPRVLEERGLVVALHSLTGSPAMWGPQVTVDTGGLEESDILPPEIELALYRIAQEAVANARRHSGAARVEITLETRPGSVRLAVRDNGHGLERDQVQTRQDGGAGIPGMRERVAHLGGTMAMASGPAGTTVRVVLPLPGSGSGTREGTS